MKIKAIVGLLLLSGSALAGYTENENSVVGMPIYPPEKPTARFNLIVNLDDYDKGYVYCENDYNKHTPHVHCYTNSNYARSIYLHDFGVTFQRITDGVVDLQCQVTGFQYFLLDKQGFDHSFSYVVNKDSSGNFKMDCRKTPE